MALERNADATVISLFSGDTGSFVVAAERQSGTDFTEDDRMQFTVTAPSGEIVMQRWYRLDDDDGLGNGIYQMEFHNGDTDEWPAQTYSTEFRYAIHPYWKTGTAPEGKCVDALTSGNEMISGDIVDTVIQGTLTIRGVLGKI